MNPSDLHDAFERLAEQVTDPSEEYTSRLLAGIRRRKLRRRRAERLVASGVAVALLVVAGAVAITRDQNRKVQVATDSPFGTPLPRTAGPSAQSWATGRWTELPKPPVDFGADSQAFWVNGRLVVVKPKYGEGNSISAPWTGATFDPDTAAWTVLPATPGALGAGANVAVAGDQLLAWGGYRQHREGSESRGPVRVAFALDPSSSTWHRVATPPEAATSVAVTTWTGTRLAMVNLASGHLLVSYDPEANTWSVTAGPPDLRAIGRGAVASSILWTGQDVLVWFDDHTASGPGGRQHLERYNPIGNQWSHVSGDDRRPAVTDVAMVHGKVTARELTIGCEYCATAARGRIVTIDTKTGAWSTGPDAPTAYVPADGRPGGMGKDPVDPGSQQFVVGQVPVRLAVVGEPKVVAQSPAPEPGQWPMTVEAYDGTSHHWVAAVRPPQQLHPIMRKDQRPFPSTPDLLWTGRSLVVWGQFNCVDSSKCAQPRFTQGLLYTPEG